MSSIYTYACVCMSLSAAPPRTTHELAAEGRLRAHRLQIKIR